MDSILGLNGKTKVTLTIAGCVTALIASFSVGRLAQDRDARLLYLEKTYLESNTAVTSIERRLIALEGEVIYIRRLLEQEKKERRQGY